MKKLLIILIGALLIASCASGPEPEEKPAAESIQFDLTSYRQKVIDAKAEADQLKAVKGAPETYAEAEALYQEAQEAEKSEEWETAQEKYEAASAAYRKAYEEAAENREKALAALEEAKQAISKAEKNAEAALQEAGIEGGTE